MDAPDAPSPKPRKASGHTPLRIRLDTLGRVRRELARLYVEGRDGRRDVADVSRLASVLAIVARLIEGGEIEKRLEALEAREQAAAAKPRGPA